MNIAQEILSDITVHMKYSKYLPEQKKRESWKELVDRNKEMHIRKYPQLAEDIEEVYKMVYDKKVLAPLGAYWESLHPLNSWGGNGLKLVDTPHFSRGDGKPEWRRVT